MSIASAVADIRSRRKLIRVSEDPPTWRVKSTAGDYFHELRWLALDRDVVCDTCVKRHGINRCWARTRALADIGAVASPVLEGAQP
jgi:hypothetical protein